MKKYLLLAMVLLLIFNVSESQIKKDEATKIAFNYIDKLNLKGSLIYLNNAVIQKNFEMQTFDRSFNSMTDPSYVFFIDKFPLQNWAHQCSYLFVNSENGSIKVIEWNLPPNDLDKWALLTRMKEPEHVKLFDFKKIQTGQRKTLMSSDHCYAIIISGGGNPASNWSRYWNDCSAVYSALVNVYGYQDSHIKCLIADGTNSFEDRRIGDETYDSSPLDLDGDSDDDIDYSATKSNISSVFNSFSSILDTDDNLFIFVTDHGTQESGQDARIILWGTNEYITDDEFAYEVNKINAAQINIMMEQCFSGGFIDDLAGTNRVLATACAYNESSYAMGAYSYDEFVFDWVAAVAGEDPYANPVDADSNDDGFVSMHEAFNYAEANDSKSETPQYSSPDDLGYFLGLGFSLYISGSDYVCSSVSEFNIYSLAASTSVFWDQSGNILRLSDQGTNPGEFEPITEGGYGTIDATLSNNSFEYSLRQKEVWVGVPYPSTGIFYREDQEFCVYDNINFWTDLYYSNPQDTYYNWNILGYLNANVSSGQGTLSPMIYSYDPGYMTLSVTAQNGCGSAETVYSQNDEFYFDYCFKKLNLFPNPAADYITIQLESDPIEISIIDIYDSQSRKVMSTTLTSREKTIDISGLPKGLYYLTAFKKGKVITEKFIKK